MYPKLNDMTNEQKYNEKINTMLKNKLYLHIYNDNGDIVYSLDTINQNERKIHYNDLTGDNITVYMQLIEQVSK